MTENPKGSRVVRRGNKTFFLPNDGPMPQEDQDSTSRSQVNKAFFFPKETPVSRTNNRVSPAGIKASVDKALAGERDRANQIKALGAKFGFSVEADQFAASGRTVDDFRNHILEKSPNELRSSLETPNELDRARAASEAVALIKERRRAQRGMN